MEIERGGKLLCRFAAEQREAERTERAGKVLCREAAGADVTVGDWRRRELRLSG